MSLKITNKLTAKQRDMLQKLNYIGKWDITTEEAAKVIDELIIERNLTYGDIRDINNGYYDIPDNQLDDKYYDGTQTYEQDNNDNQWK